MRSYSPGFALAVAAALRASSAFAGGRQEEGGYHQMTESQSYMSQLEGEYGENSADLAVVEELPPGDAPSEATGDALLPYGDVIEACELDGFVDAFSRLVTDMDGDVTSRYRYSMIDMFAGRTFASRYSYFQKIGSSSCSKEQQQAFDVAFADFETCAGFSFRDFLDDFPSAVVGTELECALAIAGNMNLDEYTEPSIPEGCATALLGSNPFGDMSRNMFLHPDIVLPCFEGLGEAVPDCLYETTPIPIVGSWLKSAACVIGMSKYMIDGWCVNELALLEFGLHQYGSSGDCRDVDSFGMLLSLPQPLLGAPLPDACYRVAEEQSSSSVASQYEDYRNNCASKWEGWEVQNRQSYNSLDRAVSVSSVPVLGFVWSFLGGVIFGGLVILWISHLRKSPDGKTEGTTESHPLDSKGSIV